MMQDWFKEAKLGIFVHYGMYAVDGVSESWSFHNGYVPYETYMAQKERFTAQNYDPTKWAELFREAGARYAVLTTKHHDGLCLWDTETTSHNVVDETPAGRDLIAPYTTAMREAGLKVGLYYSLSDWSREDYRSVYQEGTDPARYAEQNPYESPAGGPEDPEAWQRHLAFNRAQMKELMTQYGDIDLLWFDGDWERSAEQWEMAAFRAYLHTLNPNVVLNSRLRGYGDYATPELGIPMLPPEGPWEFCIPIGGSWGWMDDQRFKHYWKSSHQVIRMFCDCLTFGGNMLLDVGPTEDGIIPDPAVNVLKDLGHWIQTHEEAVYPTQRGLDYWFFLGGSTLSKDRKTLYLFVYDTPTEYVTLKGIHTPIQRISVLHSQETLDYRIIGAAPWNGIPGTAWIHMNASHCFEPAGPTVLKVELEAPIELYYGQGQAITHNQEQAM